MLIGMCRALIERIPRPAKQENVTDLQGHFLRDVRASPLHGQDHEVAAAGDYSRIDPCAEQVGPEWNHHFRHSAIGRGQRIGCSDAPVAEGVLIEQGSGECAQIGRDGAGTPARKEPRSEHHRDGDGAEQQRYAHDRELEEAKPLPVAFAATPDISTFTGDPVIVSSEPACAAKTTGMRS
jgi:hypothetical protein